MGAEMSSGKMLCVVSHCRATDLYFTLEELSVSDDFT
tara:strand:- start:1005 stop:1115 length:111 start_codon:yes stop_codon:yes gene_type:complete